MARIVTGPLVSGQVVSKQTGSPLSGVTVTVSATVYTDPEMTTSATSVTSNGSGIFSFYAVPNTYTFTLSDANAAPLEPVEVLSPDMGAGQPQRGGYLLANISNYGTIDTTGVTSSAAALQAAFDQAKNVRLGKPGDIFLIDAPIFLDLDTSSTNGPYVLEANGATIKLGTAGLPTASTHTVDAAVWAFHVNTKRQFLSGGVVTCTADSTHRATGNGFPAAPRFIVRGAVIDSDAALAGFAYGNTAAIRFENCTFKTLKYGMSWTGYADGSSASHCHLATMPSNGWLIYQATNGDGIEVDFCKSTAAGLWYAQSCKGGVVRGPIQGGFEFHYCSGIMIDSPHAELAGTAALDKYITSDNSQIVVDGPFTYAGSSAGEYFLYVNDSAADLTSASDITLRNFRPQYYPGTSPDFPRQPDIYINATNTPFKLRVERANGQTVRSGRTEYNPDSVVVASAVAGITTAIAAARSLTASSSWVLRNIAGAWEIGTPSPLAGISTTRALTSPTFATQPAVTSSVLGVLVNGTNYEYAMACKDQGGNYTAVSAASTLAAADANGCLIWQATIPVTPCTLVVWRRVGGIAGDVLTIPDAYVELPLDGVRTKLFDTGTQLSGHAWVSSSVPVPNTVAATNATSDGILFADGTWVTKSALASLASARIASAVSTTNPVNTLVESDLARLTIPAGQPKTNDKYVFVAFGDLLNNSGGSVNYTFKFYLGATLILTSAVLALGSSASRRLWECRFELDMASTTAERYFGRITGFGSPATTWNAVSTTGMFIGTGIGAKDTATATDLALTVTMGTANAATDGRCLSAYLSRIAA